MTYFYKKNIKSRKNNNLNNNRHNVLKDDMEIEAENEMDEVKIITRGKYNNM